MSDNPTAYAEALRRGLAAFGANFVAEICGLCDGEGSYLQTYTAGCGMGTYRMTGRCDCCAGTGLMQGRHGAPRSVLNQVLVRGGYGTGC